MKKYFIRKKKTPSKAKTFREVLDSQLADMPLLLKLIEDRIKKYKPE